VLHTQENDYWEFHLATEKQINNQMRTAKSKTTEVRQPAEWFNPVLDQALPELADKLAEINADAVVKASGMMIK
jgi:hypothetical protein